MNIKIVAGVNSVVNYASGLLSRLGISQEFSFGMELVDAYTRLYREIQPES